LFKKKFGYIRTIFYFKENSNFKGLKLIKLTCVQKFYIFTVQLAHKNKKIWTEIELYGPVHTFKNLIRSDFAADSDLPVATVPVIPKILFLWNQLMALQTDFNNASLYPTPSNNFSHCIPQHGRLFICVSHNGKEYLFLGVNHNEEDYSAVYRYPTTVPMYRFLSIEFSKN